MTSQQHQEQVSSLDDIDVIFDSDAHLTESPDQLTPYLDEPYKSYFADDESIVSPSFPSDELFRGLGGKVQFDIVMDPADEHEAMTKWGSDYVLLTPSRMLQLPYFSDDRYAHALSKAYNDFILTEFLDESYDGFKAPVTITTHQPDKAAEEIDRVAGHDDIVGGLIGSTGITPGLGDRRYDPIWDALESNDLPLVLHGVTGGYIAAHPEIKRALKTYWELHIISHPLSQMIQMSSIMGQGIPERYPDVDIVFQEGGLGWIPYTMFRMDNEYEKRRPEVPLLEKSPSDYITDPDGPFYFTSQPMAEPDNTEYLAQIIRMFNGTENLLFSTDYPHYDFDSPDELFNMIKGHFNKQELQNIYGGTAMKVFGVKE